MRTVMHLAREVAKGGTSVLLTGETGTGKEVLARYVHACSPRAKRPFVALNCGALPAQLVESELFGHERGAFSGAIERRVGYFEAAHTGTLLLDEVSELPQALQTRLLRVLQERQIQRVGASRPIDVDVRVVATTNRDLRAMVEAGEFRKDLFYRLNVFPIEVPPLRARKDDLDDLVATLLGRLRPGQDPLPDLTLAARERLRRHDFPGNVRELANLLERALILTGGDGPIDAAHLLLEPLAAPEDAAPHAGATLEHLERRQILRVLSDCGGNRTHASRRLGISLRTLRNKLRDYRHHGVPIPEAAGSAR
ncbi:MAG: sigma 54-interacting transcriptional regulator [Deltaproteobacteria bacterium]|nr:sigma 54-interacting transcriptional regulator [Deltaproteobacteria bacterium]